MQKQFDSSQENLIETFTTSIPDNYVIENVIIGNLKPSDKISFDRYSPDIKFSKLHQHVQKTVQETFDNKNLYVINLPLKQFYYEFFLQKIIHIFSNAPQYSSKYEMYEMPPFKYGFQDYLSKLFELFIEIAETEIPNLNDENIVPDIIDFSNYIEYQLTIQKLLSAIKIKHLRTGGCIDRYVKNLPFFSYFVNRLIKKQKDHYRLANNNIESLDYKLALLSSFHFLFPKNAKLFELKIKTWEERNSIRIL